MTYLLNKFPKTQLFKVLVPKLKEIKQITIPFSRIDFFYFARIVRKRINKNRYHEFKKNLVFSLSDSVLARRASK